MIRRLRRKAAQRPRPPLSLRRCSLQRLTTQVHIPPRAGVNRTCCWGSRPLYTSSWFSCSRTVRDTRGRFLCKRVILPHTRKNMLSAVVTAAAVGLTAPSFLGVAAATRVHNAQPHAAKRPRCDDPTMLYEQHSQQQQLRRTIENAVLSGLATGILEHREKVERGELRPRPFVTLTYAQSIDGSIAAADKSQVSQHVLGKFACG